MPVSSLRFLSDLFGEGRITIPGLGGGDMVRVEEVVPAYGMDFDDACQQVVCGKNDLVLISFDTHFDRTARKRVIPADLTGDPAGIIVNNYFFLKVLP
jgi:predicted nucleic acid-binding protein